MKRNQSRRSLLKLVSSATVLGFAGQTTAQKNPKETQGSAQHQFDIEVRNNTPQEIPIRLNIHKLKEGEQQASQSIFQRDLHIDSINSASAYEIADVGLSGGKHVVEVELNDQKETSVWRVPTGGIPDWMGLSIRVRGNGELTIATFEI